MLKARNHCDVRKQLRKEGTNEQSNDEAHAMPLKTDSKTSISSRPRLLQESAQESSGHQKDFTSHRSTFSNAFKDVHATAALSSTKTISIN